MAGDGHGTRRPEAELVLYTLPRNPYDPPCSAIPLSLGQEKLPGAIRACQPGLRHGPGVTSRFAFGGCSARVSRPRPPRSGGPAGLQVSRRDRGWRPPVGAVARSVPRAPGLPLLGSGSRQSLKFVPSLFRNDSRTNRGERNCDGQDHQRGQSEGGRGQDHHRHQPRGRAGQVGPDGAGRRRRSPVQRDQRPGRRAGRSGIRWSPGKPLAESVVETSQPRLFVLPGSQSLADADALVGLEPAAGSRRFASSSTGELGRFDYVFLDCPPSLGQLTRAALGASAEIYIPIQCEYFAMEGLSQIIELARQTKARDNHRLEIGGIVLTMFDPEPGAWPTKWPTRSASTSTRPSSKRSIPRDVSDQRGAQPRAERARLRSPGPRCPGLYGTCHGGHRP